MNPFLQRLIPERWQKPKSLEPSERVKLLSTVPDTDNCLRAVQELLQQNLEQEFHVLIDPTRSDRERLSACEGARVHFWALKQLAAEHEQGKELRK